MKKVLIIEDDLDIAELEKDYLQLNGYHAEIVHDGADGLKMAVSGRFDIVGYSGEKGQSNCRESGRCSAVKAATIPVKKTSAKRESRGWCFYTVTVSALWSSIDRFRRIDSPFSSSL